MQGRSEHKWQYEHCWCYTNSFTLSYTRISMPALCSKFFRWHLLQSGWEQGKTIITGASFIAAGLLGDGESQRGKSWGHSQSTPRNEMENTSKLCVLKGKSRLWAVPVFYPLTCLEMVKRKYCKYSFPEVYPCFWCYSHYSTIILQRCDFLQKSKRFLQQTFFFPFLPSPEAVCLILALSLLGKSNCILDVTSCHTYLRFHACSNTGF